MDPQRPIDDEPVVSESLSRRTALWKVSAGGLAAALLARGFSTAVAQDVSPTPVYAAGVTPEILGRIEPPGAPGYTLQLVRVTFAPGAVVAAHRHSGGTVTTEVSGSHAFTVLEGNARLIRAGNGHSRRWRRSRRADATGTGVHDRARRCDRFRRVGGPHRPQSEQ